MRNYTFLLLLLFSGFCYSQDTIVLRNGRKIIASNIDTNYDVFYRFYGDTSNNWFKEYDNNIYYIRYANGKKVIERDMIRKIEAKRKWRVFVSHFPDKTKLVSVDWEPMEGAFEAYKNIGLEIRLLRFSIGGNIANDNFVPIFAPNPFSPGQNKWPGTVYYGNSYRINAKFYYKGNKTRYIEGQLVYKKLHYQNVPFEDDNGDNPGYFTKDENMTVKGFDIIWGHEVSVFNSPILLDYFAGFGLRYKYRYMNTYNIQEVGYLLAVEPISPGPSYAYQVMFTPVIGIRIGLAYFYKSGEDALK